MRARRSIELFLEGESSRARVPSVLTFLPSLPRALFPSALTFLPSFLSSASSTSMIFSAADSGDPTAVLKLLDEPGAASIDARDDDGRTLVHHAAAAGHTPLLQALLGKGAAFETVDGGGWSPLHSAASAGRAEAVAELVTAGASLETGAGSSNSTALIFAASKGHAAVVQTLLGASANAMATDKSGAIPLHRAAGKGHIAVMEILLAALPAGAMINTRDKTGHTAFHIAAIHEQVGACIALAEANAELDTENAEGEAPASLLKPSLRSQLGLLLAGEDAEMKEDHTDWLGANYPVPKVPKVAK